MSQKQSARTGGFGKLTHKPSNNEGLIPKTLKFIRDQLPAWRDDSSRPKDVSEKSLNSYLCVFLNACSRSDLPMVVFQHEETQSNHHSPDLGAHGVEELTVIDAHGYSIYKPFLVIEAKRLPSPGSDREREYVTGAKRANGSPTGGVQRFKLGLHGADLETAAMICYIQEETSAYWYEVINQWIMDLSSENAGDDCEWRSEDKLGHFDSDDERGISTSVSNHHRAKSCRTNSIRIHHLWVEMGSASKSSKTQ